MSGISQGSVLGSTLYIVIYDEVLCKELSPGCETVANAKDLTLILRAGSKYGVIEKTNSSLTMIMNWMEKTIPKQIYSSDPKIEGEF